MPVPCTGTHLIQCWDDVFSVFSELMDYLVPSQKCLLSHCDKSLFSNQVGYEHILNFIFS